MATMVKWSPLREFELLDQRMRRLLEGAGISPLVPAADVYETKDEFVLELDVPGFAERELTVEAFDHTIVVKGEHKVEETDKTFHLRERLEKHFERRFEFPSAADTGKVKAVFGTGVLELHAPKLAAAKPHAITIGKKA